MRQSAGDLPGFFPAILIIICIAQGYIFHVDFRSRLSGSYPLGPGSSPAPKGFRGTYTRTPFGFPQGISPLGFLRIFPKAGLAGLAKLLWMGWFDWPGLAGQAGLASLAGLARWPRPYGIPLESLWIPYGFPMESL